jgi:DNA repair protein RecN (Recombination protein N)
VCIWCGIIFLCGDELAAGDLHKKLVLIDELRMEFEPGFNALTGETGAGKSIIMDALGLISGERVRSELVRNPEERALVEATFFLDDNSEACTCLRTSGLLDEEDNIVVISREIIPGGRSLVKLNGHNVSLGQLKGLIPLLLDMHLQHEHLSILKPSLYLQYLDGFVDGAEQLLKELAAKYMDLSCQRERLENIRKNEAQKLQQMDFLTYQIEEIEKAQLYPGEEEELSGLRHRIRNAQRLLEGTDRILDLINGNDSAQGAIDLLAAAIDSSVVLRDETGFSNLNAEIEEIYYSLQDISSRLNTFRRELDFEPGRLDEIEDRLYENKTFKK